MEREYRLIIGESHEVEIRKMDGSEVDILDARLLHYWIKDAYEPKDYIYLADACRYDRWDQFKIGVSGDLNRRATQLSVVMDHWIPVSIDRVYKVEREIHKFFHGWRVDGEWFKFDDDLGKALKAEFETLKNEGELRAFMHRNRERVRNKNFAKRVFERQAI